LLLISASFGVEKGGGGRGRVEKLGENPVIFNIGELIIYNLISDRRRFNSKVENLSFLPLPLPLPLFKYEMLIF
jgi:hypothetical protein